MNTFLPVTAIAILLGASPAYANFAEQYKQQNQNQNESFRKCRKLFIKSQFMTPGDPNNRYYIARDNTVYRLHGWGGDSGKCFSYNRGKMGGKSKDQIGQVSQFALEWDNGEITLVQYTAYDSADPSVGVYRKQVGEVYNSLGNEIEVKSMMKRLR